MNDPQTISPDAKVDYALIAKSLEEQGIGWSESTASGGAASRYLLAEIPQAPKPGAKVVLVLHGFDPFAAGPPNPAGYTALVQKLASMAPGWSVVFLHYDTSKPFKMCAQSLMQRLQGKGWDLNDCVIVAYSMGGLVARQMIADGLNCRHLLTLCTPHHGAMSYLFGNPATVFFAATSPGALSISAGSHDLWQLNNHPRDLQMRGRYHLYGITYSNNFVPFYHPDDAIVAIDSAMFNSSKVAGWRHVHHQHMAVGGLEAHLKGAGGGLGDPWDCLQTAFARFRQLIA